MKIKRKVAKSLRIIIALYLKSIHNGKNIPVVITIGVYGHDGGLEQAVTCQHLQTFAHGREQKTAGWAKQSGRQHLITVAS